MFCFSNTAVPVPRCKTLNAARSPFDISSRAQLDVGGSATVTVGVAVEVVVMRTATGLVELHVMHRMATGLRH